MRSSPSRAASGTAARLIVLCVLSILGGTSLAMDESPSSSLSDSSATSSSSGSSTPLRNLHFSSLVDPREPLVGGKRAYTYRSEYKRLPLYQFGLGKRWVQNVEDKRTQPFSFGLGKRTRQYSFGLGKRSNYEDGDASRISFGYLPNELYETYAQKDALENYLQGKRSGRFNFGLGKRDAMNEEMREDGLHEKVPVKHSRDKYLFGLGKRFYEDEEEEDAGSSQLV